MHISTIRGAKVVSNIQVTPSLCSNYKGRSTNSIFLHNFDMCFCLGLNNAPSIIVKDSNLDGTSKEDFTAAMNGVQLVYPLATPKTYQLTPTEVQMLLGTNNLWADTGDVIEGKYWGKNSSATRAMLNTLQDAGEITPTEEPEESDER